MECGGRLFRHALGAGPDVVRRLDSLRQGGFSTSLETTGSFLIRNPGARIRMRHDRFTTAPTQHRML